LESSAPAAYNERNMQSPGRGGITRRALVAAQAVAFDVLRPMLEDLVDMVPVHSSADAFKALEDASLPLDLIISTVAFDDSRMVEFLQAVQGNASARRLPFLCVRVLPGMLSDNLMAGMRGICKECGAVDLIDLGAIGSAEGRLAIRGAVMSCLGAA
jgi:hypothetical protein